MQLTDSEVGGPADSGADPPKTDSEGEDCGNFAVGQSDRFSGIQPGPSDKGCEQGAHGSYST